MERLHIPIPENILAKSGKLFLIGTLAGISFMGCGESTPKDVPKKVSTSDTIQSDFENQLPEVPTTVHAEESPIYTIKDDGTCFVSGALDSGPVQLLPGEKCPVSE